MTASERIRVMSPELALKIAAGEVVERPASAVKELLDNALDAGAKHVKIETREAGLKLIRVADDGCGIPRDDVPLAFESHATSKIRSLEDLESLTTLGFRGEALPSIAAVSRLDVQTRSDRERTGSRFEIEYGAPVHFGACSAPRGTRISVWDLFSNVPARRKFVRSLRAETGQIMQVTTQYALAQPAVQLSLVTDESLVYASPGTGNVGDALASVYGPQIMPGMLPVSLEEIGARIEGLVSAPSTNRSNRSGIHVFVNGRVIQNRSLAFALEEAYSGYLMVGRHPIAVIHIWLPPDDVDANVHPSKNEVRFARDREVHGLLHRAVANALLEIRHDAPGNSISIGAVETEPSVPVELPLMEQAHHSPEGAQQALLHDVPTLRVFGQTKDAFIIAEGPDGLYMIDQHAAHERILFDQLDDQLASGTVLSQPLLEPATLDLNPGQIQALDRNAELLTRSGFVLEPFGPSSCLIRAIPALSARTGPCELVAEVLHELQNLSDPGGARERALAAMACNGAVKAGQTLDVREMRELVSQLEHTHRPATCPHGRPTMIHLSHLQLEREFGRR